MLPSGARWGSQVAASTEVAEKPQSDASSAAFLADAAKKDVRKVVLDSGSIIKGRRLEALGDAFWTVKEVLAEVKDSNARMVLETMATELTVREVDPECLAFVTNFSKLTGDYPKLSGTDLKVMALTYQLEKQFKGTAHLNTRPRPIAPPQRPKISEEGSNNADEKSDKADDAQADDAQNQEGACEGEGEEGQGEEEDDDEDIDPSEFERQPLHDGDNNWPSSARPAVDTDRSDAGSHAGSHAGSQAGRPKAVVNLPGWYDGDDDNAGWITPESIKKIAPVQCEEREDKDDRVACATTDFAMQNVLMQIGLRVVDMDGLVIKSVKKFVLKCHACFKITHDTTLNFCPSCGNATMMRVSMFVQEDGKITYSATMMRVSMFVQEDGKITYSKGIKAFSTRGTRYSLPLPKQGRGKDDLVLREDQLLTSKHRRRKPKAVADEDGFMTFSSRVDMQAGQGDQEIIGMGYAGGGRRNPNSRKGAGRR